MIRCPLARLMGEHKKHIAYVIRDTVRTERESGDRIITEENNKQILTKLFLKTQPLSTPKLIGDVVEQIDKLVKATRFEVWQQSNSGPHEIQKTLMVRQAKLSLDKDKKF